MSGAVRLADLSLSLLFFMLLALVQAAFWLLNFGHRGGLILRFF